MVRRYAGIDLDLPLLKRQKVAYALKELRAADPFLHSIVIQQIGKVSLTKEQTMREEDHLRLHARSIGTHHAWLASWLVRFALEREQVHHPDTIKQIQVDTIRKIVQKNKQDLSLRELRFVQQCADRIN